MVHLRAPSGDLVIELFQFLEPIAIETELEPARVGNAHLCFLLPDLGSTVTRLEEAGATFFSAPVEVDTGANAGGLAVYLRDPDGITLELFQPAPTSETGRAVYA